MTRVIENIELLKKLQPYLEYVETEYWFVLVNKEVDNYKLERTDRYVFPNKNIDLKTLTLEEAIELLPEELYIKWIQHIFTVTKWDWFYWVNYDEDGFWAFETIQEKTLLEAIEKMLEYLIDNDLLWNK